jgi:hypothetical protein
MSINKEIWRDIVDFEGYYQVSSLGRVRSLLQLRPWEGEGRVLSIKIKGNHYLSVALHNGVIKRRFLIHRLVAAAFIPNPEGKPEVNHINFYKYDNRVENLEWVTKSENSIHNTYNGYIRPNILEKPLKRERELWVQSKKVSKELAVEIKEYYEFGKFSIVDISKKYGLRQRTILKIIFGINWQERVGSNG